MGYPPIGLNPIGGEDGYKFYDYYYGTGRYQVKCFETVAEALAATPMPLPDRRPDAYFSTFPHDVIAELAADSFGLQPGTKIKPVKGSSKTIENFIGWAEGAGRVGAEGFWLTGKLRGAVCGAASGLRKTSP